MQLVSQGNQNVILNGNPEKSFFKCTYKKYTNYGKQKSSIPKDYQGEFLLGQRELAQADLAILKTT